MEPANREISGYTRADKLAIALACVGGALAIVLFLVEKTPTVVALLILAMAGLMVYPVLHFFQSRRRRGIAFVVLAGCMLLIGMNVWPRPKRTESPSGDESNSNARVEKRDTKAGPANQSEQSRQFEPPSAITPPQDLSKPQVGEVNLYVRLTAQEGYTTRLKAGQKITAESMKNRKQYLLTIANKTISTFSPIDLRIQWPYPVDESEVFAKRYASEVEFEPIGSQWRVSGGGTVHVFGQPLHSNYTLHIDKIEPQGHVELLLVLNSRQVNGIPPRQVGPADTYIHGSFRYRVGEEMTKKEFYAALGLGEDKTVTLGKPQPRPKELHESVDIQF